MEIGYRSTLVGLAAAVLMAACVGSATAGRLSLSHGSLVRATWAALRFQLLGITGAECPVTLEASYHSTTSAKVVGTLSGYMTRALLGRCITGSATILSETLPWHIQYGGFNETLPRPRPILNLVGSSWKISNALTGSCVARTTSMEPSTAIAEPTYEAGGNGIIERIRTDEIRRIECVPLGRGNLAGSAAVTESPGGARNVLLRLI